MDWNELIEKCEQWGIQVGVDNVVEQEECNAVWVPELRAIIIDHDSVGNEQVLAHELVHAIDPECQEPPVEDDWKHYARAEIRAEHGARCLVDDPVDDGYIDSYAALLELDDVLDQFDAADQLIANL